MPTHEWNGTHEWNEEILARLREGGDPAPRR
jgi:hypothetical protein